MDCGVLIIVWMIWSISGYYLWWNHGSRQAEATHAKAPNSRNPTPWSHGSNKSIPEAGRDQRDTHLTKSTGKKIQDVKIRFLREHPRRFSFRDVPTFVCSLRSQPASFADPQPAAYIRIAALVQAFSVAFTHKNEFTALFFGLVSGQSLFPRTMSVLFSERNA